MMINKIQIEGFKSIKSQEFEFRGLTILTGLNSTGKSSVIQSLLLISSFNSINSVIKNYINKFSTFEEIRNRYENVKEIKIDVYSGELSSKLFIKRDEAWNLDGTLELFNFEENLFYLSSNRTGQEDKASYTVDEKFGIDGKHIFGYFEQNKRKVIDEKLVIDEKSKSLETHVTYWLKYILDIDLRLLTSKITGDTVKVTFNSDEINGLSPFNVGAGNSYLAKILIMGLSCKIGHILIIENPEIHLHPKAQSHLADFFVLLENAGIQVILETHSEHLINKFRYNVYKKKLESDNVVVYYKSSIQEEFDKILINTNGHFVNDDKNEIPFPNGFFDSTLSELLEIM